MEVLEVMGRNSGREPFPKLLRRQKLPKHGSYGVGIRPASEDTLRKRSDNTYHWSELRVGDVVNVFGRELTLRDCDEHTRGWYEERLGLTAAASRRMLVRRGSSLSSAGERTRVD